MIEVFCYYSHYKRSECNICIRFLNFIKLNFRVGVKKKITFLDTV